MDITAPAFDAVQHGVDAAAVHRVMHVKVGAEVRTGVAAFLALWEVVPGYRWLARLARLPGVCGLMGLGYHLFARLRPWLPRRKHSCTTGTCSR